MKPTQADIVLAHICPVLLTMFKSFGNKCAPPEALGVAFAFQSQLCMFLMLAISISCNSNIVPGLPFPPLSCCAHYPVVSDWRWWAVELRSSILPNAGLLIHMPCHNSRSRAAGACKYVLVVGGRGRSIASVAFLLRVSSQLAAQLSHVAHVGEIARSIVGRPVAVCIY